MRPPVGRSDMYQSGRWGGAKLAGAANGGHLPESTKRMDMARRTAFEQ